ncbi:hypothetical protein DACRYDRAFT_14798 [Dacryopinax primogenitus]|uniref:Replication factor A C-terminal domain-containing protein n=1 Tax=Dacryopinax primogenitus (strain DJM 731) TaxID=1858805 RepID=M5GCC1_DACPD|nr:uncharacterized protein DACRYDRAFT_14798 [Dacryopinax primogenitus]EJU03792.1 hypothetical protein DACRYDRAFT_14798 [Dacryopinax primogenitus]
MAVPRLSTGCIEEMVTVSLASDTSPVILQLLECSKELNAEGNMFNLPYFILTLLDGASFVTKVVLHSSVVPRLHNEEIEVYNIITLTLYESWANIVSDWQAGHCSLGYVTAPYKFHYVWPLLPQAVPPPLTTQITMISVGVVPPDFVAPMLPVLPPPPVPIPTQVNCLLPINCKCTKLVRITRIRHKDKGTINVLCHNLMGEIDLVVCHPVCAKFANVEVGKWFKNTAVHSMHPSLTSTTSRVTSLRSLMMGQSQNFILTSAELSKSPNCQIRNVPCIIANTSNVMHRKALRQASYSEGNQGYTAGAQTTRVDMWLLDNTGCCIHLVAFDKYWLQFDGKDGKLALLKNICINKHHSLSLKTVSDYTKIFWNPASIPGYAAMVTWLCILRTFGWDFAKDDPVQWHLLSAACSADGAASLASRHQITLPLLLTITEVCTWHLDEGEIPQMFRIQGRININKEKSITYAGCATLHCNTKATTPAEGLHGIFDCETCDQNYMAPVAKYCLYFTIVDDKGQTQHPTAFDTAVTGMLNIDASMMSMLYTDVRGYQPIHACNLTQAAEAHYVFTVQASTRASGFWKGHKQWIVTETQKIGHTYDINDEE